MAGVTGTRPAPRLRAGRVSVPPVVGVAAALVALLTLVPLAVIAYDTVGAGWSEVSRLVFRDRTLELLANTGKLVVGSVSLCVLLGVGAAYLVWRTDLPFRRLVHVAMVAPLAVPAFVNAYAWSSLVPSADGYSGALVVVTLSYFPLVYLPVTAALRGADPALVESAAALGLSASATFRRVTLPQLRPAVLGGGLLVALHLVAEFGALALIRFPTLSTAVYDQFRSSFSGPAANTVASVLVLVCLLLLTGELTLRGRTAYARVGGGAARASVRIPLGRWTLPAAAGLLLLTLAAVVLPVVSVMRWFVAGSSSAVDLPVLLSTTASTLGLGVLAALTVTVAALPVAWLTVRRRGVLSTLVERITYIGTGLPGIVVALALVTLALHALPALYQTTTMLVAAYAILFLPRAIVSIRAGLLQLSPSLEDAAATLGVGPIGVLVRVVIPVIAPALGSGAALAFLGASTELTATLLLSPLGTQTLATQFWSYSSAIDYGAAAPYAALLILVSAPAAVLLTRYDGQVAS
ncbi:iron ABC transporter permease [Lapillicoccus sp.]|uniref:ABC transporter permease n=1 Tax=Lapillicoccus sp. TaxID=1909287 RepID=UPI0025EA8A28|nr:iron ABC transporter permease [Lapillicoccus sp.]